MSDRFFYELNGRQFGPISFEELKQVAVRGDLRRTDRIWSPGMEQWQKADSVAGLFDDLPPDVEPEDNKARTALNPVATQPQTTDPPKATGMPYWVWLILIAIVVYWKYKSHQYAGQ